MNCWVCLVRLLCFNFFEMLFSDEVFALYPSQDRLMNIAG